MSLRFVGSNFLFKLNFFGTPNYFYMLDWVQALNFILMWDYMCKCLHKLGGSTSVVNVSVKYFFWSLGPRHMLISLTSNVLLLNHSLSKLLTIIGHNGGFQNTDGDDFLEIK